MPARKWSIGNRVASQRVVRPAFERTISGWKQADPTSLPPRMEWTIAFDGRNLGKVQSQADPQDGLTAFQTILTPAAAVPSVGSPSEQFAGLMANPIGFLAPRRAGRGFECAATFGVKR